MTDEEELLQLVHKIYFKANVGSCPILECWINRNWKVYKMAEIIVVRKFPERQLTIGVYIIDMVLGTLSETYYMYNYTFKDYEDILSYLNKKIKESDKEYFIKVEYELVHNIIYGTLKFSNYEPEGEFQMTKYILEKNIKKIKNIGIEFGKDGEPSVSYRNRIRIEKSKLQNCNIRSYIKYKKLSFEN